MIFTTINPTTGKKIKSYRAISPASLSKKIASAGTTFTSYKSLPFAERSLRMMRLAGLLETQKHQLASLMTLEMGKTLTSAVSEAEKCAWVCRFYAENAERFLADDAVNSTADVSYVRYEPLGVVLAIMPWNFPFWQVFRFGAAALMAGNVILLKHAPNVPQCALKIEELVAAAGFPEGTLQTLLVDVKQIPAILKHPIVKAVTVTGSVAAGSAVAGTAGKFIKKSVLELGGSDPFIVMPSANLSAAVETAVTARIINNGQSCIAAKRFIIHEQVFDQFTTMFVGKMKELVVGDPMDAATHVGPLARLDLLEKLDTQVKASVRKGARVLLGARRLNRKGFFYAPTVLTDILHGAPAFSEEIFGPVASLFRVANIDEAISLANATSFGLGGSAWTNDESEQKRFVTELDCGAVFLNGMVASDPRLPFGGMKNSGFGRELGKQGIREFTNIKTVWIRRRP